MHGGAFATAMVEPRTPMGMHPPMHASMAEHASKQRSILIDRSATREASRSVNGLARSAQAAWGHFALKGHEAA
jgi:hypothetical protein